MATLNELAYDIKNKFEGGKATNNSYLSLDQIKFNINYYRALLVHRDFKQSSLREPFEQEIKLEFSNEDNSSFGDIDLIFKSTKQIPNYVRLNHTYPLSLYNSTYKNAIQIETFNRRRFRDFSKYTSKNPTASIKNNYIFISSDTLSTIIDSIISEEEFNPNLFQEIENNFSLVGIFENPSEAYIFDGKDPEVVDDLPYPISQDMSQRIIQSIINGDFQLMKQISPDVTADNLPNINE